VAAVGFCAETTAGALSAVAIATQAAAQVTFYEHQSFQGQSFTTEQQLGNLERIGFNNRASSARVRGDTWQVCEGAGDQYWRARMMRLVEVEKADQAFDAQLRDRFNTGFAAGQGEFTECGEASLRAERQAAVKGRTLAARLARSMRVRPPSDQAAPDSVADH